MRNTITTWGCFFYGQHCSVLLMLSFWNCCCLCDRCVLCSFLGDSLLARARHLLSILVLLYVCSLNTLKDATVKILDPLLILRASIRFAYMMAW
jgi:hypothetical protein